MVSTSTKSPAFFASGRGIGVWNRFHGLRFLVSPRRSSVRFTDERLVVVPSRMSSACTTSALRCIANRFFTIASIISSVSCAGCDFGRDDSVGIAPYPRCFVFFFHAEMAPGENPKYRAAFRTPCFRAKNTASRRIRGIRGFVVYIGLNDTRGVHKVVNHNDGIDKKCGFAIIEKLWGLAGGAPRKEL